MTGAPFAISEDVYKRQDITIVYKHGKCPRLQNNMAFSFDDDSRAKMVAMSVSYTHLDVYKRQTIC